MHFSTAERALYIKLVYYGPGQCGKTTNLETIHRLTDPRRRQPMVSLKTEGDRTLFFDLLPFDLGKLYGMNTRVKLFTVPGQIQYDTTRKQVLSGADGVVFVADSSARMREANLVMIRYLKTNLEANGIDAETVPLVFQWNKRDLPDAMPVNEMDRELNWRHAPGISAVATRGTGVLETFCELTAVALEHLSHKAPQLSERSRTGEIRQQVQQLFQGLIEAGKKSTFFATPSPIGRTIGGATRTKPAAAAADDAKAAPKSAHASLDELLQEAVRTNLALSERLVGEKSIEQVAGRIRNERQAVLSLVRLAQAATDLDGLCRVALRAALTGLEVSTGSILHVQGPWQPLREVAVAGRSSDPLNSIVSQGIGSVATGLLDRAQPLLTSNPIGELMFGQAHPALEGLRCVLATPISAGRRGDLLLVLYSEATSRDLDDDDLEFAQLIAAITSLALRAMAVPTHAG